MADRADIEVDGLQAAEGTLDAGQVLVGALDFLPMVMNEGRGVLAAVKTASAPPCVGGLRPVLKRWR
jgi:hypothetical protein